MPLIREAITDIGLPAPLAQAVGASTAAAIGAAAADGAGAASEYNVDVKNRQLHPTERGVLRAEATRTSAQQTEAKSLTIGSTVSVPLSLTGQRYLDGYASDDAQYAALMTAGATFAQQYGLRPGIALTPEQMATLTSDIVWLQSQTVTLPDGSTQDVLVPKVYVAQPGPNAVKPNGALITGDHIRIEAGSITSLSKVARIVAWSLLKVTDVQRIPQLP